MNTLCDILEYFSDQKKILTIERCASFAGTETLHFREFMNLISKQFHFYHCKSAERRYPDKGACALKWGAPLCGVIGYDSSFDALLGRMTLLQSIKENCALY